MSLLLVGVVSDTFIRHLIQIVPAAVVLLAVVRRAPWVPFAALAVFIFWLAIMVLIWLWLLGLASIVTGEFSSVEVTLTVCIGLCCLVGIPASLRNGRSASWRREILGFGASFALQVAAMWLSLR